MVKKIKKISTHILTSAKHNIIMVISNREIRVLGGSYVNQKARKYFKNDCD